MTDSPFEERTLDLMEGLHPLERIPRAGYLLRGVPAPESVAAHGLFVSVLALTFTETYPEQFDRGKTLAMALIHDVSEAELMDIPMPSSNDALRAAKRALEEEIFKRLFAGFPSDFTALYAELTACESPESRLIHALDKAQMMIKIHCYEREGHGNLAEFWETPRNFQDYGLPCVTALFDALCRRAGRVKPVSESNA